MDINDFVVEANGAGIREALRIVLDIGLKMPKLVLIEEPEVHLHPGLEQALHSYLKSKSKDIQLFVTTHSTSFVDASLLQNIYLVSRDEERKTVIESVISEEDVIKIPDDLGLRLSTVFMYDRLVFVEGRSDEEILRQLAGTLGFDLARASVGFVQMRGVRNFSHFAAEGTLDLLSRRRMKMWFITDRDERGDEEVARMLMRLGERAQPCVLMRRELENYLLEPHALAALIAEKMKEQKANPPTLEEVKNAIYQEAMQLREEVVRLRLEKEALRPLFLQTREARESHGVVENRIKKRSRILKVALKVLSSKGMTSKLKWKGSGKKERLNLCREQCFLIELSRDGT